MERDAAGRTVRPGLTLDMKALNEQQVRQWAVEQVFGALVNGNNATPSQILTTADKVAQYVLTGEVPSGK